MFKWIKKTWKALEEKSDHELEEYLERCNVKDAKPCPFCGEEKIRLYKKGLVMEWYYLMCSKCGAGTVELPSKESAKKYWNQRVGEKQ